MPKPNIASLSLNLDGCRFGDDRRRQQKVVGNYSNQQTQHSNQIENLHPNNNNQQQQLNNSPLSTHYYKHAPQYNNPVVEQHPPSPLDTTSTYRHDGLSIGHNFLRFQGSTFNKNEQEIQCMNDLIIEGLVGRGVCSSVWKARRRKDDDDRVVDDKNDNIERIERNVVKNNIEKIESNQVKKGGSIRNDNVQNIERHPSSSSTSSVATKTMTYYALKQFPLHDPSKRSMLIRELKLLCNFHCDTLVELQGAFLDNEHEDGRGMWNTVTLVLEYMDCGSLCDLMNRNCSSDRNSGDNVGAAWGSTSSPRNDDEVIGSPNLHLDAPNEYLSPTTPGTPLFRHLSPSTAEKKHGKVPQYVLAAIAYQMLWGLGYLHYEGVLHRDIKVSAIYDYGIVMVPPKLQQVSASGSLLCKQLFVRCKITQPANVLVSSSGKVKLADFGIVSQQQRTDINDDGTIMNHTVVGTTRYMSPERLRGKVYTRSSDVWSLGLVLLEVVRGDSPFEDVTSVVSFKLFICTL